MDTLLSRIKSYEAQFLSRRLLLPQGDDFCSNDYLGFATDAVLQNRILKNLSDVPTGSAGSRLLRGHSSFAVELEKTLAQFSQREAALFFPSGYQANLALLSSVLTKDFIVYSDAQNHASIIDGIKLSGCEKKIFKHNDLEHLKYCLEDSSSNKNKVIVVERVYSMSGDTAPIVQLAELAQAYSAQLIVDEAHSTGIEKPLSSVLADSSMILATMHSAGKALGVSGAWIACDEQVKNYLIQFARPFIYSTAPSPMIMKALQMSVEYWSEVGEDRALLLKDKSRFFYEQLTHQSPQIQLSGRGPIFFVTLGSSEAALQLAERLQQQGIDIRAIRYPTVEESAAGLRISIHANHSESLLMRVIQAIAREFYQ